MGCKTSLKACFSQLLTASLNSLIHRHCRHGRVDKARKLFDENPSSREIVTWNMMLSGYVKTYRIQHAKSLFHQTPVKDVVCWNTMLSGFSKSGDTKQVYHCYLEMGRAGCAPNEVTFSLIISSVLGTIFSVLTPQFHALVVRLAHTFDDFIVSALLRAYACLKDKVGLQRVFDEIPIKDVSSWNSLVSGYMELGCTVEAQRAFETASQKNVVTWTTLVHGYVVNRMISTARSVFNQMLERNMVSWTVMIRGYAENGMIADALELFLLMTRSDVQPNHFTYSTVLNACACCSSISMCLQIHSTVFKLGMLDDVILTTSLVDAYAKSGEIESALNVFQSMPKKTLVSWNSILGGCARNGLGTRALQEFEQMAIDGTTPDHITFVNVLSACAHEGLVEAGERHFETMRTKYSIEARIEHYACMVDLFGRAGQLEKAEKLIKEMPFEPDVVVWGALLSACGLNSNVKHGEFAAQGLCRVKRDHHAAYSILARIHGENGVWSRSIESSKMMKDIHAKKQEACSWTQLFRCTLNLTQTSHIFASCTFFGTN